LGHKVFRTVFHKLEAYAAFIHENFCLPTYVMKGVIADCMAKNSGGYPAVVSPVVLTGPGVHVCDLLISSDVRKPHRNQWGKQSILR